MNSPPPPAPLPLGLLELDPAGTVIRYAPMAEQNLNISRRDVLGRDFFTEVMPAAQLYGFRARFLAFMASGQAVEKFSLRVPCDGGVISVQVVLAATAERSASERRRLALVRIMPERTQVAA